MKKQIIIFLSALMLSLLFAVPAMADNYTGWSLEQDKVVYYVNGVKQTNVWVLKGNTLHYIGADGLLDNTRAADISAASALGITNYLVANQNTKYDVPMKQDAGDPFSAAKYAFNVANDYEAFLWLYPQYKVTLNAAQCYDYYLSSYHIGDTPNKYLQALDGYVNVYTNMPIGYGYRYEPNYDKTHKNYSSTGMYKVEECASPGPEDGKYRCHYCGATYSYLANRYHYVDDHPKN